MISLRADFYGHCTKHPRAGPVARPAASGGRSFDRHELRAVITSRPSRRAWSSTANWSTRSSPRPRAAGALPLVSHALGRDVASPDRRPARPRGLSRAGSIAAAIARTAENVYGGFQPAQRVQARAAVHSARRTRRRSRARPAHAALRPARRLVDRPRGHRPVRRRPAADGRVPRASRSPTRR